MLKERFKVKVGVFLVLIENNKVLLSRRYNTGIADGRHVLPMGGLEEGETMTEALIREVKEEVNITLLPDHLQVAHVMHRFHLLPDGGSFPQVDIYFVPSFYEGTIENREPHKCDELQFYDLKALPATIEPFIAEALRHIDQDQFYSEVGWLKR
jgi:8-oxo-dGTP diphosphatase